MPSLVSDVDLERYAVEIGPIRGRLGSGTRDPPVQVRNWDDG